ncbi:MAG: S8 family serine peptidase [Chitinivibrionia bacterium]|nr:S8 family serine peptidase [Chitinivibrionia bacterium]
MKTFFLILAVIFVLVPVQTIGAEKFAFNADKINLLDEREFLTQTMELLARTSEASTARIVESNGQCEFAFSRIIARTQSHDVLLATNPREFLFREDGLNILQFDTPEEAQTAFNTLLKLVGDNTCCSSSKTCAVNSAKILWVHPDRVHENDIIRAMGTLEQSLAPNERAARSIPYTPTIPANSAVVNQNFPAASFEDFLSWGAPRMGIPAYTRWLKQNNNENVRATGRITVAIIDMGIDFSHPFFINRRSPLDHQTPCNATHGFMGHHGNAIAGPIADFTRGLPVDLVSLNQLHSSFGGDVGVAAAIDWARINGVHVMNVSQTNFINRGVICVAVTNAINAGMVVVGAASNSTQTLTAANSCTDGHLSGAAIVVAAFEPNEVPRSSTNRGSAVDFVGPGRDVRVPFSDFRTQGVVTRHIYAITPFGETSQASPHIAAAAALILLNQPHLTPAQVKAELTRVASFRQNQEHNRTLFGAGFPDLSLLIGSGGGGNPPVHVPVTNITGVITTDMVAGGTRSLSGTVIPTNATHRNIVWSVSNAGTTGATISGNTLSTPNAGTVVITATITNGATATTNFTRNFNITVNPQSSGGSITISRVRVNSWEAVATGDRFVPNSLFDGNPNTFWHARWSGGSGHGRGESLVDIDLGGVQTVNRIEIDRRLVSGQNIRLVRMFTHNEQGDEFPNGERIPATFPANVPQADIDADFAMTGWTELGNEAHGITGLNTSNSVVLTLNAPITARYIRLGIENGPVIGTADFTQVRAIRVFGESGGIIVIPPCEICGENPCICIILPPTDCPDCGNYPCTCPIVTPEGIGLVPWKHAEWSAYVEGDPFGMNGMLGSSVSITSDGTDGAMVASLKLGTSDGANYPYVGLMLWLDDSNIDFSEVTGVKISYTADRPLRFVLSDETSTGYPDWTPVGHILGDGTHNNVILSLEQVRHNRSSAVNTKALTFFHNEPGQTVNLTVRELILIGGKLEEGGGGTSIRDRAPVSNRYGIILENAIVSDFARISVITPEPAQINLRIIDNLGNVVFTETTAVRTGGFVKPAPNNDNTIVWNLTNRTGRFVANGTYLIVVEATGISGRRFTYSARVGINR